MAKAEAISRHEHHVLYRRGLKKKAKRIIRRAAKSDPENAPTKLRHVTRGWSE
jgi:hypothetical protein